MDLKEEHLLGARVDRHWYYRAKLAALLRTVRDLDIGGVLDVGAGSGFFSRALLHRTGARAATCIDPNYPDDRDETVAGKPLAFRRAMNVSDANLVLMMDVIEHVPDDRALVADYIDKVPPGTRFVVTVPAFMWLWSNHDVYLEHYRRYDLKDLKTVLGDCGIQIERAHYFYGAVLPLVAGVRLAGKLRKSQAAPESDMRIHGDFVNGLLLGASRAEVAVMGANRLAGTTVFARAIKP